MSEGMKVLYENVTILKNLVTCAVSPLALILGLYYYNSRKKFDTETLRNERRKTICETLLSQINKYDEGVTCLLECAITDKKELENLREKIRRDYCLVYAYLESCSKIFKPYNSDFNALIKLNSFVDNDCLIMSYSFDELLEDTKARDKSKEEYKELLQLARVTCLKNSINFHS